uniref:Uncharacterized protein n=1 Tax=Caenorhabditis tropicalis TaxID=1561998 RepID=A0A1I7USF3_9PELO
MMMFNDISLIIVPLVFLLFVASIHLIIALMIEKCSKRDVSNEEGHALNDQTVKETAEVNESDRTIV